MNEPVLAETTPKTTAGSEEPRSWWLKLWHKLSDFVRPPADAEVLREVVEELIEEPLSESGLLPSERLLLGNIMHLREKKVGDCMVPRADIIAVEAATSFKELAELIAVQAHSRIPVYRETLDDVIGMVHMKDVMAAMTRQEQRAITDLLRPVVFVAPSMPVAKLLMQMRQTRQHMAVVVDEFGGIDGMVTIEDLVEEIVGEIDDEHDAPLVQPIIARADGTLLVDARLPLDAFQQQTGVALPPLDGEDVDTLGGYVANLAGRVPHIGESFHNQTGLRFDVLEMDQTRIKRLRVRAPRRTEPDTADSRRAAASTG
jgi:CBS domain containing-hemolysin-like protein